MSQTHFILAQSKQRGNKNQNKAIAKKGFIDRAQQSKQSTTWQFTMYRQEPLWDFSVRNKSSL